jgi:hypothetical protein
MPHSHIARATIIGHQAGQTVENVLHFGSDAINPDWTALALAIIQCLATTFHDYAASAWSFERMVITPIYPVLLDPIDVPPPAPIAGTNFTEAMPTTIAGLISIKTGGGGRSGRGRMYCPGVIKGDVANNDFTDGGLAKLVAFAVCMATKFITAGDPPVVPDFFLGVLSRKNHTTVAANVRFRDASALVAQRRVASMRSRAEGHGI